MQTRERVTGGTEILKLSEHDIPKRWLFVVAATADDCEFWIVARDEYIARDIIKKRANLLTERRKKPVTWDWQTRKMAFQELFPMTPQELAGLTLHELIGMAA